MNKVQGHVDDPTYEALIRHAKESGCSVSYMVDKIITCYLHDRYSPSEKSKNHELLLRCNNIASQVLRCVWDEKKVSIDADSAAGCLKKIKDGVRDGLKGKNEEG